MPQLPNSPDDRRNRRGCFIILGILALFLALYLLVSFNSAPDNSVNSQIPTLPAPKR